MPWIRTGTVSVTQNSTTVTGTSTKFVEDGRVGDALIGPDGAIYEVTNIASNTALAISPPYKGANAAGGTYALVPIEGYVKDTADALRQASLEVGQALDGMEESVQSAADSAAAAVAARDTTLGYRDAAASSAAAADDSEAQALAYRNAAQAAADTATTQAGNAGTARTAAEAARDAAQGYRDNASASAAAAAASAAAANGVGSGYLEGLIPVWNSGTSISIGTGAAFMPSSGKVMRVTAALTLSGLALATGTWYYLYLYDNAGAPALELVNVAPAAPYSGSARTKTGDTSRRFIGAFRTENGTANLIGFDVDSSSFLNYRGNVDAAPFLLANGAGSTTVASFSVRTLVPTTTNTLAVLLQAAGTAYQFIATGGTGGKTVVANPNSRVYARLNCSPSGLLDYYSNASGQTWTLAVTGYGMDR